MFKLSDRISIGSLNEGIENLFEVVNVRVVGQSNYRMSDLVFHETISAHYMI